MRGIAGRTAHPLFFPAHSCGHLWPCDPPMALPDNSNLPSPRVAKSSGNKHLSNHAAPHAHTTMPQARRLGPCDHFNHTPYSHVAMWACSPPSPCDCCHYNSIRPVAQRRRRGGSRCLHAGRQSRARIGDVGGSWYHHSTQGAKLGTCYWQCARNVFVPL